MARKILALGSLVLAGVAIACGGTDGSEFDANGGKNTGPGTKVSIVGDGKTDPGTLDPSLQACASSVASGQLSPVTLAIMFDKSGSMAFPDQQQDWITCDSATPASCGAGVECIQKGPGDTSGYCASLLPIKWTPAKNAFLSFFQDASSANIHASLDFFPKGATKADGDPGCQASTYSQGSPLTTLPSTAFAPLLAPTAVFPGGGTPTLPALTGALQHATTLSASGERTVVVLVTDGRPNDCGSTPENVAQKAKEASAKILTYVIGVGLNDVDNNNLDLIAASGGTQKSIRVSTGNTQVELLNALNAIRSQIASCSFTIPTPPDGKSIDFNAVNVSIGSNALTYSKDCASGEGWHYDDPTAPKRIDLCKASCDASSASGGKVSMAFGCATKGGVIL